ncbi:MAG: hypothetical protein ACD_66C00270G0004 [uncultured bacterium]|nr:MAG: hypothetical protein ACD_66C00270G0004 [uncultured bacterium]
MSSFQPKPFGKYFLVEKIAVGGMAEIYKAKTFGVDGFEKLLAIKKILPHYSSDKEFISMLTDEAKLVVRLSHTNIVQIYDLGKVAEDYYISMEFIDGVNLREIINRAKELKEKITLPLCLYIISEISKGLDYAHSKRDDQGEPLHIVHRDISPQNILLSFEGETKIVDFGIAKAALNISHTSAGILKGKVTYMSPEQALGKPIDGRTDVFSAGIILYELITGERLFSGDSQIDILNKIRVTPITEETLKNQIPDEVRGLLAKALAYHPKDRFETAGDFQIALTKLLYSKYSDFSSKNLAHLIKKLFANELKIKKKRAQEEASISSEARVELEKFQNQKSLLVQKTTGDDSILYQDTTRPEDKIKPEFFKDTAKPEDQIHTQLRIDSGIHREPQTQKSISVHFKKTESTGNLFSKKMIMRFVWVIIVCLLGFMLYQFKPWERFADWTESISHTWDALTTPKPVVQHPKLPEIKNEIKHELPVENAQETEPIINPEQVEKTALIELSLKSIPEGALIYLNGENTGLLTPAKIGHVPLDTKTSILLRKEGFQDVFKEIVPNTDSVRELEFNLVGIPKEDVSQKTNQEAALKEVPVEIKNKEEPVIETPKEVVKKETVKNEKKEKVVEGKKVKETKVKTDQPGSKPVKEEIRKTQPESTVKSVETGGGAGQVRVDSSPRGAAVTIDGRKAGITPVVIPNLSVGSSHSIVLILPGYKNWSRSVTASKGRVELNANLTKE